MVIVESPDRTKDPGHHELMKLGPIAGTVDAIDPKEKFETTDNVYKEAVNAVK